MSDFNDDYDADEMAAYADDERKARREEATPSPVRLDPLLWMPPVLQAKASLREIDAVYDAYRKVDRPYRRAFGATGAAGGRRYQIRAAHALAHIAMKEQS